MRKKNPKAIDKRKNMSAETNEKKAAGGRAGAMKLKRMAQEAGIRFSAFARVPAQDEAAIEARIEQIVQKAREAGTLYRLNYVSVHGSKVG